LSTWLKMAVARVNTWKKQAEKFGERDTLTLSTSHNLAWDLREAGRWGGGFHNINHIYILFFINPYTFNSWLSFMILGNSIHTE